jgi:hypothetical protein
MNQGLIFSEYKNVNDYFEGYFYQRLNKTVRKLRETKIYLHSIC